jgi:outer membrane protein
MLRELSTEELNNMQGGCPMNRIVSVCAVLIVSLFLAIPVMAAKETPLKIGVVDTPKILRESKEAKNANDILQKDLAAKRATLVTKEKELRRLDEEVKKATGKDRKTKADTLAHQVKDYKRLDSDLAEELKNKQLDLTQKLMAEIMQVVKTISDKEKYTLILEKGSVILNDDSVDITDRVIKTYDSQKK